MQESQKAIVGFFVAGGDAAVVFDTVEEARVLISVLVDRFL